MILLLIIGIVLTGFSVSMLIRVTVWGGMREASAGVPKQVEPYGFARRTQEEETTDGVRGKLDDVATKLGAAVGARSTGSSEARTRRHLMSAGLYDVSPGRFAGYRIMAAVGLPILWIWLAATVGV